MQAYQTPSTRNKSKEETRDEVISDDKIWDSRNVERRKIIKRQTSQRRASLADSIAIAKLIIDGHSKNKDFEKKASERRRVIKHCTSARRSSSGEKQCPMSFFQELQAGCSVILPSTDHQKSVERSKTRRRTIKDHSVGKRRRSLEEEIGDAKKVIEDSERKYEISPAEVEKVSDQNVVSYFNTDTFILLRVRQQFPQEVESLLVIGQRCATETLKPSPFIYQTISQVDSVTLFWTGHQQHQFCTRVAIFHAKAVILEKF